MSEYGFMYICREGCGQMYTTEDAELHEFNCINCPGELIEMEDEEKI